MKDELQKKLELMTMEYATKMLKNPPRKINVKLTKTMTRSCGRCHFWVSDRRDYVLSKANNATTMVKEHSPKNLCTYSRPFMELNRDNEEVMKWVVVHEVAHLRYRNHTKGHSELCEKFGVLADGFPEGTKFPDAKYMLFCECGCPVRDYYRRPAARRRVKCPSCGKIGKHKVVKR